MKNHPGHFWICVWLFCITMNGCDMHDDARKQLKALERIEAKMPPLAEQGGER